MPLAGDGPVWGARGSQWLGKGAWLCRLPPFSPPQRKITAGNGVEVTWSPSANLGRFALLSVSSCFNAQLHNSHGGCSSTMQQHTEPGKCMHLVIKKMGKLSLLLCMSFWGGRGSSATAVRACAHAFQRGPAFPAQCSSPALGQS